MSFLKKYSKIGIRVLISVLLIYFLIRTQDVAAIKSSIISFDKRYLLIGLMLQFIGVLVSSFRWREILLTSGVKVPVKQLYALYIKGYFYNNFLPTQLGGDAYKSIALGTSIKDQPTALFSVFMDRFGGLIILLVLALFGIGSLYGLVGVGAALLLLIVGGLMYFPLLKIASKKVKFLKKFKEASDLFMKNKKKAFLVLFYSFLVQVISFSGVYILFLGLDVSLPLWSVVAFMPITSLSLLIPSFNGFGTQETVYSFLFKGAGVTEPLSITVSIMLHVLRLTLSLIGGLLILLGMGYDVSTSSLNLNKGTKENENS
jgi:glycosyltransferase 2 family protein